MDENGKRATVQIDYSYLKSDGSYEDAAEDPAVVVMTAADRGTGMYTAMSVPANNFEKDYIVKSLKAFVAQLGHTRIPSDERMAVDGEACSLDQGTIWPANMRTAYEDAVGGQYIQCAQ